jgi:Terminase-like family.
MGPQGQILEQLLKQQFAELKGELPEPPPPPLEGGGADLADQRRSDELRLAIAELKRRQIEGLNLYEPLPIQAAFHESKARQRVIRGSNRSGKTIAAAVEIARALTGTDPHGKYPLKDGRCFATGLDLMFVGQVFYRKLFRPGAFKMIRDPGTTLWRAYRPWDPADKARRKEAKPAPPLIPPRLIESIAWENKAKSVPKVVKLTTGWEILFFSSEGKPPQGMDLDLVWFSEEIDDEDWYPEMAARLLDRQGRFVWDATPQVGNDKLLELSERADRDRGRPNAAVEEFVSLLDENPHIEDEEKRLLADLLDDDQARVRIHGEFAAHGLRVFPEFSLAVHGRDLQPGPDWTRYMAVDPGRQVCAVLFGAVPPPGQHPFDLLLYRELYLRNCSAAQFGEAVAKATQGEDFEAFLIDHHMGRQTEMGSGETVEYQYARELKKRGVRSRRTLSGFLPGTDDVLGGIELVRNALRVDPETGSSRLVISKGCVPNFVEEAKRYRYKKSGRIVTDVPETRGNVHLMATVRYLVGSRPRWGEGDRRGPGVRGVPGVPGEAAGEAGSRERAGRDLGPVRPREDGPMSVPSGIGIDALAGLAANTFAACTGAAVTEAEERGFGAVAAWAVSFYQNSAEATEPVPAKQLARLCNGDFWIGTDDPNPHPFDAQPQQFQVAWEAVARCLFGAITCGPDSLGEIEQAPRFWREWAEARLPRQPAVEVTT